MDAPRPGSVPLAPSSPIYLDHSATTPMRREAFEAMLSILQGEDANPSGLYASARRARRQLDDAREELAACLGCLGGEVVFTSGGTEADNLALRGVAEATNARVLVSAVEHRAVLRPALALGGELVPVGPEGVVDLGALVAMLDATVGLVSVMLVNSEVGAIQPVEEVASLVASHSPDALVHSDAVQALRWRDVASSTRQCDLLSVSAHKFGGPRGVGALVVRPRARALLAPQLRGGGQERGLRAGTENVAGAVAMAVAARCAVEERAMLVRRAEQLRARLVGGCARLGGVETTAGSFGRIAGIAHVRFPGVEAEELLLLLDEAGIAASAGSACASGAHEPSHVLLAMGWSPPRAREAVRFSLGPTTTEADIDAALAGLEPALARLLGVAPVAKGAVFGDRGPHGELED